MFVVVLFYRNNNNKQKEVFCLSFCGIMWKTFQKGQSFLYFFQFMLPLYYFQPSAENISALLRYNLRGYNLSVEKGTNFILFKFLSRVWNVRNHSHINNWFYNILLHEVKRRLNTIKNINIFFLISPKKGILKSILNKSKYCIYARYIFR